MAFHTSHLQNRRTFSSPIFFFDFRVTVFGDSSIVFELKLNEKKKKNACVRFAKKK